MCTTLKPSMFNYSCRDKDQLILYNSLIGTNSIVVVNPFNVEKVEDLLSREIIDPIDFDDITRALFQHGLLVPIEDDEKLKRDFLFSQTINDSTLDLVITLTEKCNFVCKYCAQSFTKNRMTDKVQENIIQFVRKNISKYQGLRVEWFGGEPLLCIDIIRKLSNSFIDICRKAHKVYTAAITTNGYLLDLETFRELYDSKVSAYQITLDGLQKEHDSQRCLANQSGTYDTILSNLLDIKNNIRSSLFRINIRTNFTKRITDDIDAYLRFYESKFMGDNRFSFFIRAAEDWGGERVKAFNGLLNEIERNTLIENIHKNNPKINFYMNYSFLEPARSVCHAVHKNMFNIGCDGKVYKCDSSTDLACIGELYDGGKMKIDEYKVALWSCGTRSMSVKCDECFFSCSCIKGVCPLDSIREGNAQAHLCPFEKNNINALLKLFIKSEDPPRI